MQKRDLVFVLVVVLIFILLVDKYYLQGSLRSNIGVGFGYVTEKVDYLFATCKQGEVRVNVPEGYLCRDANLEPSPWLEIYDTYPKSIHGREAIFNFLSDGTLEEADLMLQGTYPVPRFEPAKLGKSLTWKENPYDERYWRFIFYSLRPTQHLVYAGRTTGKSEYNHALIDLVESFIDTGMDEVWAWDDYHGVAFRTMVLINVWWKLREQNALPPETSTKILQALEQHGTWLMDEDHFESENNHGITEAAALFLLAQTFPDLPGADQWDLVSRERLASLLMLIIDEDGVQVENSPYYHFYSLEKFWDIYEYSRRHNISQLTEIFDEKMAAMTNYATYILKPDLSVPLLGASLERQVRYTGMYTTIASVDPYFEYVLTQGTSGKVPPNKSMRYPVTGQTIMRSGWGEEDEFVNHTQVVFDFGTYRTLHSDLDAMNFTLYSNGAELIVDSGLYTYEENEYRRYFHGTVGHNTVMVDGKDQRPGRPVAGEFVEGEDYTLQTASHSLYSGVIHNRALALLGHDLVLIVDHLISADEHDYSQIFHFAPGSTVDMSGSAVTAQLAQENQRVTIHQLTDPGLELSLVEGQESPPAGLCSFTYEKAVPCPQLIYQQRAANGIFITLIEIGTQDQQLSAEVNEDLTAITIQSSDRDYQVSLDWSNTDVLPPRRAAQMDAGARSEMVLSFENGRWTLTSADASAVDDRYTVEVVGDKVSIRGTAPELKQFDVTLEGINTYPSRGARAYTDLPADPSGVDAFRIYEQEDYLPIFGYHYVIPNSQQLSSSFDLHESDFVRKVEAATTAMGCRWYTLADIVENYILKEKKTPYRACVMTFDDGVFNQYENVFPLLQDFGAVATFYVLPGRVGQTARDMSWAQIGELYRYGNEIGSHSIDSDALIDEGLNREQLEHQIGESKTILESLGYDVKTFAYPLGQFNAEIVDVVRQSGYIGARSGDKNHTWMDRRAQTISMTGEHLWNLSYARVDIRSLAEIERDFRYTTWWQFEEGYAATHDENNSIIIRSSDKPTTTSYAILELQDQGDAATSKFTVAQAGTYTLEIYAVTGEADQSDVSLLGGIKIYVDGQPQPTAISPTPDCQTVKWRRYCLFQVENVPLTEGVHTLTIEAATDDGVMVDKYRIYREFASQQAYDVDIVEYTPIEKLQMPKQVGIRIEAGPSGLLSEPDIQALRRVQIFIGLGVIGAGIALSVLYIRVKKARRNTHPI